MEEIQDAFLHADFKTALTRSRAFLVDPVPTARQGTWSTGASEASEDTLVRLTCIIVQCVKGLDDDHLLLTVLSEMLHMSNIHVSTFNIITGSALQLAQMKHYNEAQLLLESYLWPTLRISNVSTEDDTTMPPSGMNANDGSEGPESMGENENENENEYTNENENEGSKSPPDGRARSRARSAVDRIKSETRRERRLSRAVPELPSVASTLRTRDGLTSEEIEIGLELYIFHVMLPMSWAPQPTPAQARRYQRSVDALCAWLTHPSVTHLAPAICARYAQLLRECECAQSSIERSDQGGEFIIPPELYQAQRLAHDLTDPCALHDDTGFHTPERRAPSIPTTKVDPEGSSLYGFWEGVRDKYISPYSEALSRYTGQGEAENHALVTPHALRFTAAGAATIVIAAAAVKHRGDLKRYGGHVLRGLVGLFAMAVSYNDTRSQVNVSDLTRTLNT